MNKISNETNLYYFYTDDLLDMRDYFLSSIKDNWKLNGFRLTTTETDGNDFGTKQYLDILKQRTEIILGLIKQNFGEYIIMSDIDIQFFAPCTDLINESLKDYDAVYLIEHLSVQTINGGFIVINCNDKMLNFYTQLSKADLSVYKHFDQTYTQQAIQENVFKAGVLPTPLFNMVH